MYPTQFQIYLIYGINKIQGVFYWSRPKSSKYGTGPALKILSMELVPPNKEIDWFRHKKSKYGTGPTQEKKMNGSAQHIETAKPVTS